MIAKIDFLSSIACLQAVLSGANKPLLNTKDYHKGLANTSHLYSWVWTYSMVQCGVIITQSIFYKMLTIEIP